MRALQPCKTLGRLSRSQARLPALSYRRLLKLRRLRKLQPSDCSAQLVRAKAHQLRDEGVQVLHSDEDKQHAVRLCGVLLLCCTTSVLLSCTNLSASTATCCVWDLIHPTAAHSQEILLGQPLMDARSPPIKSATRPVRRPFSRRASSASGTSKFCIFNTQFVRW